MNEHYRNEAQLRLCKVIALLAGNEINGVAPSELAKALATNPSNITRDLANLQEAGFAEEIPDTGRYRLGPKLMQMAMAYQRHLEGVFSRYQEVKQRYSREPY